MSAKVWELLGACTKQLFVSGHSLEPRESFHGAATTWPSRQMLPTRPGARIPVEDIGAPRLLGLLSI